ncbi:GNAT family N-acetyltransferase [Salinibacterium hongtaonis]|nr:GNAT family N-acetyltransferase [Salinibacterium hongtaonis]
MIDTAGALRIAPATDVPEADMVGVFGVRGDPAHCFCQYFKLRGREWNTSDGEKRRMLCDDREQAIAEARHGPGLVAYLGDEAVGWCAVEPRVAYPRLLASNHLRSTEHPRDDPSVWAVTCFVVKVGFRRRGIAGELLSAAVDAARAGGARTVEGYAVDTSRGRLSAAELYHGTLSLFVAAGFRVVGRPGEPGTVLVELGL